MTQKDRNAMDYLEWTAGNEDLMNESCISHRIVIKFSIYIHQLQDT